MNELRFTIEGKPQPKQRARRGKGGRWYTPRETREYEMRVRGAAVLAATHEAERWPVDYEGAVAVEVHVYWPDARRRDVDNVVKSVLDGMQARPTRSAAWRREGGVILDDAQVRDLRVTTAIDR
ncbi:MAG TPA: RusA family crossover junction endodeoxyribonuclease, partial [Kofleriaceae bacterium]|nr:RusA family crossover junction endodeoxyribonuclease [Kofleriaceae bacterium]